MTQATYDEKKQVIDILSQAFDQNQSVNYIIRQGPGRAAQVRALMNYSFKMCYQYGAVYLNDEKTACALVLFPDQKKTTLKSLLWDIQLILYSVGVFNIYKAMSREAHINAVYPVNQPRYYIWFIGVLPPYQHQGIGSELMQSLIFKAKASGKTVFLETSTLTNLPWYKKLGFDIYNEQNFGYSLFFLKNN